MSEATEVYTPAFGYGVEVVSEWYNVKGRVVGQPSDKYGDYTVRLASGRDVRIAGFHLKYADVPYSRMPRLNEFVVVTDGTLRVVAKVTEVRDGMLIVWIVGRPGRYIVHPTQVVSVGKVDPKFTKVGG